MIAPGRLSATFCNVHRNLAPGSTGTLVKAGISQVYAIYVGNTDTNNVYLKIYDKATAGASTDTPIMSLPVIKGTAFIQDMTEPIPVSLGLSYRVVQGQADNDTTAPTSATCTVNLLYR